jgi:hypothetical protein
MGNWNSGRRPNLEPMPKCSAPGCANSARSRSAGLCETHYYRVRRGSKAGMAPIAAALTCKQCNDPLPAGHRPDNVFCSAVCRSRAYRGYAQTRACFGCGEQFHYQNTRRFCSATCKAAWARNKTHIRRAQMRNTKIEVIRPIEIFERDAWRCQLCGKKAKQVAAPHSRCNTRKQARPIGQLRLFG